MIVPYHAALARFSESIMYLSVHESDRQDSGWGSELAMRYYREGLGHEFDPMEAVAFCDKYWNDHRFPMTLIYEDEIVKMSAVHSAAFFRWQLENDPVARLRKCFKVTHVFRIFELGRG